MTSPVMLASLATVAVAVFGTLRSRYARDLNNARARLEGIDRHSVSTEFGSVEYAEHGSGTPLLVCHGIFHGCDGGLLSARDVVGDRRVISPSRFGYLGSTMPPGASAAAQAEAFLALLDRLQIARTDVFGISAGTGAALQLALRHPDRVRHLVISSGNWPGSPTSEAPPSWAKVFYTDAAMWTLKVLVPPMMRRLMGVPKGFPRNDEDAVRIEEMLNSVFPVNPRARGAVFDAFSSNPEVNDYPLEAVTVPTLIVHAADDPLASHNAAQHAAKRISGSVLISLDSGGHLGLGQTGRVHAEVETFLATAAKT